MIWHPLTWSFWAAALTGVLFYALAAVRAAGAIGNWSPHRADAGQLRRERHAQQAALLAGWSLSCLAVAAGLGLVGVALVWQRIVPGAMCGTGVLQAMGISGRRAMFFWGLSLVILYLWQALERLNRLHPGGALTQTASRVLVSAAPLLFLAVGYTWPALMRVDAVPPVSCCAVVYDRVLQDAFEPHAGRWFVPAAMWTHLAVGAAVLLLAARQIRTPHRGFGFLPATAAALWAAAASVAVRHVWSAYYYQVLSHPCVWCLCLPDYAGVGFAIHGAVAMVVLEGMALWLAERIRRGQPSLAEAATVRKVRAAWCMIVGLIGFGLLTAGPAVLWRLRNGVWLGG